MSDDQPRNFENIEKSWIAGIYSPEYTGLDNWMVSVIDADDEELETRDDYYFDSELDCEIFLEENEFTELLEETDDDEWEVSEESEELTESSEVNDKGEEWMWEWARSSYSSDTDKFINKSAVLESPEKLKRKKWTVTLTIDDKDTEYLYDTKEAAEKLISEHGFFDNFDNDEDENDNKTSIKFGVKTVGNIKSNRVALYRETEGANFLVKFYEEGESVFEREIIGDEDKVLKVANNWVDKKGEFKK